MKPTHVPGPWVSCPSRVRGHADASVIHGADGTLVADCYSGFANNHATAARIVQCVNACEPGQDVAQIISALESALCDPEGKCCIAGTVADRAIVNSALFLLRALVGAK